MQGRPRREVRRDPLHEDTEDLLLFFRHVAHDLRSDWHVILSVAPTPLRKLLI
jgi:hypothetical protein